MIDRRTFLVTIAGGLVAAPLGAGAQQTGKVWRIGLLVPAGGVRGGMIWSGFERALQELGYREGQDLSFDPEFSRGGVDQLLADARSLVQRKVDLIVTFGDSGAQAAKEATTTTPVVVLYMLDAVESGVVASLARPGGNITGVSVPALELAAKSLEMLRAAIPHLARVGLLTSSSSGRGEAGAVRATSSVARSMGLKTEQYEMQRPRDLDRLFAEMKTARMEALVVGSAPVLAYESQRIGNLAMIHRLPTIGVLVGRGGLLMYYGPDLDEAGRRTAAYVDKILKGAKPADLPIEQPTKFDLIINLKTAKALGLTIPPSLLQRADQVIE